MMDKNTLDLSNDGYMSPELARLYNQIADDIRQEYIDLVNNLSKKHRHDRDWFVTPFACRNTYVCPVFEEVVRIFFIREVVDRNIVDGGVKTIIVDSPFMAKVMKLHLPNSVQIIAKQSKAQYYLFYILSVFSGLIKYIISTLLRYLSFKVASLITGTNHDDNYSEPMVVMETYVYSNSFDKGDFSDRHFHEIKSHLNESQANKLLYIPFFYQVSNSFTLYLKAFNRKQTSYLLKSIYL